MKLSIIIPVFNEEKTIQQVIKKLLALNIPNISKEIIVVNDGSTDATASVISNFQVPISNKQKIKIIHHEKNKGKGMAIRAGIENANGDYVIIQDADLEYNPAEISRLLEPIIQGRAKVVYGTRLKRLPNFQRDERTIQFFIHYIGNKFLSFVTSMLYGQWITDMETGYKLFPREALARIKLRAYSFDFEPEITAKLLKNKYRIIEVPISTNPRGYHEGKKLNTTKDGIIALWTLIKYRLSS